MENPLPSQRFDDPRPVLCGLYIGVDTAGAFRIGMALNNISMEAGPIGMYRRDVTMGL
jgi:hypothetical protein